MNTMKALALTLLITLMHSEYCSAFRNVVKHFTDTQKRGCKKIYCKKSSEKDVHVRALNMSTDGIEY